MTVTESIPLVAILGAVALINLAFAWLFARADRDPADFLGSAREGPEEATADPEEATADPEEATADPEEATADPGPPGDGSTEFAVSSGELAPTGDPPPLDVDGETVVCRHCGAENRPGFQYCRWCVRSGFADDGSGEAAGAAMPNRSL